MNEGSTDAVADAVRQFLKALGVDPAGDPELRESPERVARAWRDELLGGYARDPRSALGEALDTTERGLVVVTEIRYESVCPHHLMPTWGVAHVGYLPGGRIVGLGGLVALVEGYARRLVLQETLGRQVVEALVESLGARAAGVMLVGRHGCLSARGERQGGAQVVTQSFAGLWSDDVHSRAEFVLSLQGALSRRG
ncbi:MAG: GTP cyclohydrolase I [Myxococcales bacterium]|nr:GTP cyclohydrolase I [Myxococcales bacterium]